MHSKDLYDGLEFSTFRYDITVGGVKHRNNKDQKTAPVDPEPRVDEPAEVLATISSGEIRGRSCTFKKYWLLLILSSSQSAAVHDAK